MNYALKPTRIDWRDRRFHFEKHFGATTKFADSYNADIGQWMPDQNADNRPSACTGYLLSDMNSNMDGFRYSEDYIFMKELLLMNKPPNTEGADLRYGPKVVTGIGLLPRDDEPAELFSKSQAWAANQSNWPLSLDEIAAKNKKPAYFSVAPITQDWFDSIRSALVSGAGEKRFVGVGTQWSPDFENLPTSAKLPDNPATLVWGHAYAFVGWKNIGGFPYLICKTWQGKGYGDNGYCYMSRQLCNKLMKAWGTYAFVIEDVPTGTVAELKAQIMTLTDVIAFLTAVIQNMYIKAYGLVH